MTRTHTVYVADDELAPVVAAVEAIRDEWEHRKPHIAPAIAAAGDARLAVVFAGLALLGEPVSEALY